MPRTVGVVALGKTPRRRRAPDRARQTGRYRAIALAFPPRQRHERGGRPHEDRLAGRQQLHEQAPGHVLQNERSRGRIRNRRAEVVAEVEGLPEAREVPRDLRGRRDRSPRRAPPRRTHRYGDGDRRGRRSRTQVHDQRRRFVSPATGEAAAGSVRVQRVRPARASSSSAAVQANAAASQASE